MGPFLNLPNGILSEQGRKKYMETKPAVESSVLWGLSGIAVPALTEACKYLGGLPVGILPTPVSYGIAALGWILALYGRFYGANKPISGLITTPKP